MNLLVLNPLSQAHYLKNFPPKTLSLLNHLSPQTKLKKQFEIVVEKRLSDGFTFKFVKLHWDLIAKYIISFAKELKNSGVFRKDATLLLSLLFQKSTTLCIFGDCRPNSLTGCQRKLLPKSQQTGLQKSFHRWLAKFNRLILKGGKSLTGLTWSMKLQLGFFFS